ncbi:MAG: PAS domain-containing sensor histidine kinase [Acidobacteria bacterium]|nr:PAS domain-containing sensor histidine kinase [Acidobacteriota bacterium]
MTGKPLLTFQNRILLFTLLAGFPGVIISIVLLWLGMYSPKVFWTLSLVAITCWLGFSFSVSRRVVFNLQTVTNLLAALREGDYSIRARSVGRGDILGELMLEVNAMAETLREQRLGALEANALLRKVMVEIDVAIFTFDSEQRLQLVNRAGEKLLAQPMERLLGRTAQELSLNDCLEGETSFTLSRTFPGGRAGRWEIRRSIFREKGISSQLLVLTDLSRALREEERQAWQRLVRVLGHELNNSLAPIKSIAGSLENMLTRKTPDWEEDIKHGLSVIAGRAEALNRFMGSYARLARLPQPKFQSLDVSEWIKRVVRLETRLNIGLCPGPDLTLEADGDQLDQVLINLLRNAVDAAIETNGGVTVCWITANNYLEIIIEDEGMGLANTSNLFVPFFTTKPQGSGIGLVLSRQIAEAHGGTLTLQNRLNIQGCEARLRIPLPSEFSSSAM